MGLGILNNLKGGNKAYEMTTRAGGAGMDIFYYCGKIKFLTNEKYALVTFFNLPCYHLLLLSLWLFFKLIFYYYKNNLKIFTILLRLCLKNAFS